MRYISCDIETSGLDYKRHQVLEIGAILENTKIPYSFEDIPKFECIIDHNEISGSPVAIHMNARIFQILDSYHRESDPKVKEEIRVKNKIMTEIQAVEAFHKWIYEVMEFSTDPYVSPFKKQRGAQLKPTGPLRVSMAGKNFATFDKLFLNQLKGFQGYIKMRQRILDPAILFVDWKEDESLPNLTQCKNRAGFEDMVTHKAIEDAWDVVEIMRTKY
jgi:oligoribonuclease